MKGRALAVLALAGTAAGFGAAAGNPSPGQAVPHYAKAPTTRCLAAKGTVTKVRRSDSRLRAFADLNQRNSIQARLRKGLVALAFTRSDSDAKLVAELLAVPSDPYRIVVRGNVVLMYKPAQRAAFTAAVSCLRSS